MCFQNSSWATISVFAVWVGYIAIRNGNSNLRGHGDLFLVSRCQKRVELGDKISRADLVQAVKDGARLRLRPIVMTVATIVASLLQFYGAIALVQKR